MFIIILLSSSVLAKDNEQRLLHAFVSDNNIVGYLYGVPTKERPGAFETFEIRDKSINKFRLLYKVTRTGLYMMSGKLDAAIYDDGSYGFHLLVQRPNYVTIGCCIIRDHNNGAMDNITIKWHDKEKRFELLRTP